MNTQCLIPEDFNFRHLLYQTFFCVLISCNFLTLFCVSSNENLEENCERVHSVLNEIILYGLFKEM